MGPRAGLIGASRRVLARLSRLGAHRGGRHLTTRSALPRFLAAGVAALVAFGAVAFIGVGDAAAKSSAPLYIWAGISGNGASQVYEGGTLGVGWGTTVELIGCLAEDTQAVSVQFHEDNGWMSPPGGSTSLNGSEECYSANLPGTWSWFGSDTFYATFGGNGNYTAQNSANVGVSMGSNLSWSAVPGGTYSYGQGVGSGISANYAAESIGYSYSGSLPSGVGWTGGGFSGTADQVGGFGGTVYATEYGASGTSEQISAGYGLTVNAVGPSWTSAPSADRHDGTRRMERLVLGERRPRADDRPQCWLAPGGRLAQRRSHLGHAG